MSYLTKEMITATEAERFFQELPMIDLGQSIINIHKHLKKMNLLPDLGPQDKSEEKSIYFRDLGNKEFTKKQHDTALHYYNIALLTAPANSRALKVAYGNRSALFFEMQKLKACLKDIEICLSSGYPSELVHKLIKRQNDCKLLQWQENVEEMMLGSQMCTHFLQLTAARHKNIPCASTSIEVSGEAVRASKPIRPGEVIIEETAYVSLMQEPDTLLCCHHCLSFSENLIPCETCCYAMFCNSQCMERSWKESHQVECGMINFLRTVPVYCRLSLKAVLKARSEVNSWDKLIKSVKGMETRKEYISGPYASTCYQNLCTESKFDQLTRHGFMMNLVHYIVIIVHALSEIPSFLPKEQEERKKTTVFIAEQLMLHAIKTATIMTSGSTSVKDIIGGECKVTVDLIKYFGFYPFTKTIRHSCNPNTVAVGLKNKIILIAQVNIPQGTEIVMSYGTNFRLMDTIPRKRWLYEHYGFICKCKACRHHWGTNTSKPMELSSHQKRVYESINFFELFHEAGRVEGAVKWYEPLCKKIVEFQASPNTDYYGSFYEAITRCLVLFQVVQIRQYVPGNVNILKKYHSTF